MDNTRVLIKKTSSGLGFLLFSVVCIMNGIVILLYATISGLGNLGLQVISILVSIVSMFLAGLFYCWFSKTDLNETIPFSRIKFSRLIMLVAIGTTVAISADYITELLQSNLQMIGMKNNIDLDTHSSTILDNIISVISVAIIPPLTEEFLFRGIILGKLRKFGDGFAIILSSSLFAILHMNIVQIPFAFIVGLVLAFVTVKSNSLLPAILIHFANNFRSVLVNLLSDSKALDDSTLSIYYIIFVILVFIAGIVSAVIISRDRKFFKLTNTSGVEFRNALSASLSTGGIITFLSIALLFTVSTIGFGKWI